MLTPPGAADELTNNFWQALKSAEAVNVDGFKYLHLSGAYFRGDATLGNGMLLRECYALLIKRIQALRTSRPGCPGLCRFVVTGRPSRPLQEHELAWCLKADRGRNMSTGGR
jgi:hypothetical protein